MTDAWLYDSATLEQILQVLKVVEDKLTHFPSTISKTTEVFLELADEDICRYYLVDHSLRVEYWLEEVSTSDLYLPETASEDHLRKNLRAGIRTTADALEQAWSWSGCIGNTWSSIRLTTSIRSRLA